MIQIQFLKDIFLIDKLGLWDKYREEADHDFTLKQEVDYMGDNYYGWLALDTENRKVVGFITASICDFDMDIMLSCSHFYIDPAYRATEIQEKLVEGLKVFAKTYNIPYVTAVLDNPRVALWVLRKFKPNKAILLLMKEM